MDQTDVGVMVTTERSLYTQRFTLAHELGHVQLGHRMTFDMEVGVHLGPDGNAKSPQEAAADVFASDILAPSERIVAIADRQGWRHADLQLPITIYQLGLRLGISFTAAVWALYSRGTLTYSKVTMLVKPGILKNLKKTVGAGLLQDSWADTWLLNHGDANLTIEAGPEDIFAVEVNERSSSGYRWAVETPPDCHSTSVDEPPAQKIGSPNKRRLLCQFAEPATHSFRLVERRPWNNQPVDELTMQIEAWGKEKAGLPRRTKKALLAKGVSA